MIRLEREIAKEGTNDPENMKDDSFIKALDDSVDSTWDDYDEEESKQEYLTLDERISNLKKQVMQNAITLRKKIRNGTVFKFKKFSKKQKKVLTWWNDKSPVKIKWNNC